ncbi:hypothetical protein [Cloacibacillus porcorum]|uniref:hypothetical protein n=1 Tax=Cloacibacillus porcorum TaxID=1197717 RepID=UPI003F051743
MKRMIEIEFPEVNATVTAVLNDEQEPEMAQRLWDLVEQPVKMANCHTLSTGCFFDARPRPAYHPVEIGFQVANLSKVKRLYCDMEPGMILFSGYECGVIYGEHITEPLVASGTFVAQVIREDLDKLYEAGHNIWNFQMYIHKPTTTIIRRKG